MIYSTDLPVILVEEEPVCRGKIVERDLRKAITEFNKNLEGIEEIGNREI